MIADLYQQKLALFQKLGQVSNKMAGFTADELVTDDEVLELIEKLLVSRTEIMGQIDEISTQISLVEGEKAQDPSFEPLQRAIQEVAAGIEAPNEIIERTVKISLENLRERTKKLQDGKQSNRAYAGRISASEGSFIDKRR